jgi:ABC-type nitrate/sulfonate/bicarbonate transport system substrate-binding protein
MTRSRAATLLLAGSSLAIPARVRAQAPAALRIAVFPSENAAEVYYAKDLGLFAKAGF